MADSLPRPEQPIARVAKSGKDVSLRIQLAIKRRAIHDDVGMRSGELLHALWRGNQAEKSNP